MKLPRNDPLMVGTSDSWLSMDDVERVNHISTQGKVPPFAYNRLHTNTPWYTKSFPNANTVSTSRMHASSTCFGYIICSVKTSLRLKNSSLVLERNLDASSTSGDLRMDTCGLIVFYTPVHRSPILVLDEIFCSSVAYYGDASHGIYLWMATCLDSKQMGVSKWGTQNKSSQSHGKL